MIAPLRHQAHARAAGNTPCVALARNQPDHTVRAWPCFLRLGVAEYVRHDELVSITRTVLAEWIRSCRLTEGLDSPDRPGRLKDLRTLVGMVAELSVARQPHENPTTPRRQPRDTSASPKSGGNRRGGGRKPLHASEDESHWEKFWEAYPKKVNRVKAKQVFLALSGEDQAAAAAGVAARIEADEEWRSPREKGRFIPHPTSWLNGRRWEDALPVASCSGCGRAPGDCLCGCSKCGRMYCICEDT